MDFNYQIVSAGALTPTSNTIKRIAPDGTISFIPFDEGNRDYQEYLAWCSAGNTPEPATNGSGS